MKMSSSNSSSSPFHEFAIDPTLSFPSPPPLSSSVDLFTQSETNHFLGFLDTFKDFDEIPDPFVTDPYLNPLDIFQPDPKSPTSQQQQQEHPSSSSSGLLDTIPLDIMSANSQPPPITTPTPVPSTPTAPAPAPAPAPTAPSTVSYPEIPIAAASTRQKPLLSPPQRRLNHIMSEQKRRNAIRDGYAQLIALLAPAGSPPGLGMPTRGRPKGSGGRSKGRSKGKSGVLFRAVEYIQWLEEGRDLLKGEVLRLENQFRS
jgi:hypothetical protein